MRRVYAGSRLHELRSREKAPDSVNLSALLIRAKQFRGELAVISVLSLLTALSALTVPWLAGQFLGSVTGETLHDRADVVVGLVLALSAFTIFEIASSIASQSAALRILKALRTEVYDHLQLMPIGFHESSRTGELLALLSFDARRLSDFLSVTLAGVPSMVLTAAGATLALLLIDQSIGFFLVMMLLVAFVAMKLVGRRMRILAQKARQTEAELIAVADSDLGLVSAIKAFATEDHHRRRYAESAEKSRKIALDVAKISAFITPLIGLGAALAAIMFLIWRGSPGTAHADSPQELFAFLLYAGLLTRPVGGLASLYGKFQIARGSLARLDRVLSTGKEPGYAIGEPVAKATGAIEFKNIAFGYPGRGPLFRHFNLTISPGEIVALTGENGIGKSTLIRLLMRFQVPDAGQILLDGRDIQTLQLQQLRRQFGYVPQRPLLFNGTIHDNIVFGRAPENEAELVERALRTAQAWDFVSRLPNGCGTRIGEDGVRISGGQQQRVALARALLLSPPIYILDEATSMYDLASEAAFVEQCIDSLKGATVIIITHRPASLAQADRVLKVGENGCTIVDTGKAPT